MPFRIASIYSEVGISFPVSWQVDKLLISKVQSTLPLESQQVERKGEVYSLGVIVSTKEDTTQLSLNGPSFSKRYKMVDYTIWIPYKEVMESDNLLRSYIDYVCQGIIMVLDKYKCDTLPVIKICEEVKREVLNNPKYVYRAEDDEW